MEFWIATNLFYDITRSFDFTYNMLYLVGMVGNSSSFVTFLHVESLRISSHQHRQRFIHLYKCKVTNFLFKVLKCHYFVGEMMFPLKSRYTQTNTHRQRHTRTYAYIGMCKHTSTLTHTQPYKHAHRHTHTNTHTHTHTHMHTHTCTHIDYIETDVQPCALYMSHFS